MARFRYGNEELGNKFRREQEEKLCRIYQKEVEILERYKE